MPRSGELELEGELTGGAASSPLEHIESPEPITVDPHPGILRGALHLLYDGIWAITAVLGTPWLLWKSARVPGFGRMVLERLGQGLAGERTRSDRPCVLIHGVSVGEVKGAMPLVEALQETYPGLEVVISSSTHTGIQVAREGFPGLRVVRFPADISPVVRRFLRCVQPDLVILLELEIWPNFLRECNRRGAPVAVVNGRITDQSHSRYLVFRRLLPQFDRLSLICVQGEEYARRFLALDVDERRVLITGSVKADRLRIGPVDPGEELSRLLGARADQLVIVAGSTHHPEERYVVQAWREGSADTRLVVVPRHPERCADVTRELAGLGERVQLLSELRAGREQPDPGRPCLVDTIGELERVYGLADVVFVGGSLVPHGGQNMLEPAAQGKPVLFGPHVANFAQEAALLLARGACRQISGPADLDDAFRSLIADSELREAMAAAGLGAVQEQKGATALTLDALSRLCLAALFRGGLAGAREAGILS